MNLTAEQIDLAIGLRIRESRRDLDLSQAKLAEMADLHQSDISLFERGARSVPASTLVRLADALGVPVDMLTDTSTARMHNEAPMVGCDHAAILTRLAILEDFSKRLVGVLGAAGGALDAAKILEREVLNPPPKEITP